MNTVSAPEVVLDYENETMRQHIQRREEYHHNSLAQCEKAKTKLAAMNLLDTKKSEFESFLYL